MSEITALSEYKKQRAKIRLSYLLLDIFLGGFIVGIVLMITLGRPENESPAIGSGGQPFILVEFYWDKSLHLYSPEIFYSSNASQDAISVHLPGFASPWGSRGSHIWLQHDLSTGYLSASSLDLPSQSIGMDGFHLEGLSESSVKESKRDEAVVEKNYGYLWLEQPCSGKWRFSLRHVEEPIDDIPMRVDIKISYSEGGKKSDSKIPKESENFISASSTVSRAIYETVSGFNNAEVLLDSEKLKRPECPS